MADVVGEADVDHYDDDIAQADFADRRKEDNEVRFRTVMMTLQECLRGVSTSETLHI